MQYTLVHEDCGAVLEVEADSDDQAVEEMEDVLAKHLAEEHQGSRLTPEELHQLVEEGTHRFDED